MCKIDPTVKIWFDLINDSGRDISNRAREDYDKFLERCLEPWGITRENAYRYPDQVRLEQEPMAISGLNKVVYQRFYIDDEYVFTVVVRQQTVVGEGNQISLKFTYERVIEGDMLPKEESEDSEEEGESI